MVCASPALLQQRAANSAAADPAALPAGSAAQPQAASTLTILPLETAHAVTAGQLCVANSHYVLETLARASDGCLSGEFAALITGPVHKGVINDAGMAFSGHTEFFAERAQCQRVVMMLATDSLRVALATTHLPLKEVPAAVTRECLHEVIVILHRELQQKFGKTVPHILVCGLNPHAGEGGHMGREEIETITPALNELRQQGINLTGPLPADTLFQPKYLQYADAVLAIITIRACRYSNFRGLAGR